MGRPYKQDGPPKGGYAPFEYKRVPIRKYFNAPRLYLAAGGITAIGWLWWNHKWRKPDANRTEARSVELALQPMLSAERDRQFLKRIVQNREWETELIRTSRTGRLAPTLGSRCTGLWMVMMRRTTNSTTTPATNISCTLAA